MIVYQSTKEKFIEDVVSNNIENIIHKLYQKKLKRKTSHAELRSWRNSAQYMQSVLLDNEIPNDSGIMIEYQIPQTSKRIDFIITGQSEKKNDYAVVIELKQWDKAESTKKDGVVKTYVGGGLRELSHPSYQAWSYAALITNFNEAIHSGNITLKPCAYLHNYDPDGVLDDHFYKEYVLKAPLFFKCDTFKLRKFIKNFVNYGDRSSICQRIEKGRIVPSKSLTDSLLSMLNNNEEFIMIDDQKVAYENAMYLAQKSTESEKNVLIVEGGPGTGKSVVAINLLVKLLHLGLSSRYVTKNSAPRAVYEIKLKGSFRKSVISNFFTGSGTFINSKPNEHDVLIVDEAHRLNEKSGLFKNKGENQIKEIIKASKMSVFFVDENQKISIHDIGEKAEIKKWAREENAQIIELKLTSQFRCNGSDGYLDWLDHILQIKENEIIDESLTDVDYDFRVMDCPNELRELIVEKNAINNKSRLVAGYCWRWKSKKDPELMDVEIPEHNFAMQWNLEEDGASWIVRPESVTEIGCIHTCQGLEVDYIGVIIGEDFTVRDGKVLVNPYKRDSFDSSIRGYKKMLKENKEDAMIMLDSIIKNTYRTLMTRGMKGCFVYCVDKETNEYFKKCLS